jgi:serine/threonine protein kinase
MPAPAHDFGGTQRFEIHRRLGEGGMGVVYEAFDRERGTLVALKTLRDLGERMSADLVLRFKNEFRFLQDLQHPNLVSLGELSEEGGHWFFTMELLDGVDFLDWVRPMRSSRSRGNPEARTSVRPPMLSHGIFEAHDTRVDAPAPIVPLELGPTVPVDLVGPPLDEARLRDALRQLAAGLDALHRAGKVHRDIKPNNIMVTHEGRCVVLDFGLVTEVTRQGWSGEGVVGTSAYMAPEQAASKPVGPEADCYAVGVVLYEALTGRLPFDGSSVQIMLDKQQAEPPAPRQLSPTVPADLDRLCMELLNYQPSLRPRAVDIVERLGGAGAPGNASPPARTSVSIGPSLFVGRDLELTELRHAFADTLSGQTVTLHVLGESGVGKTALVRRFVKTTCEVDRDAVVLQARCYERESVPFKAFDGIVDALSHHMVTLKDADAAALLPLNASLLTQVFPVLRRVKVMAKAPRPYHNVLDPLQLRMRVFVAVRELLTRLSERHPLILVVDDFQWADADSLALLQEVTRSPDAPRLLLLLIATLREGEAADTVTCLPGARQVRLTTLPPLEARRLAAMLVRTLGGDPAQAEAIAADASGHPLFIDELVRHAASHGLRRAPVHLDAALRERIGKLDAPERRLLELVAVAGGRLSQEVAARAANMSSPEFDKRLASLRVGHLVMTKGERRSDAVEPYHDRVRKAVLAHLADETRREHHEQLALALESAGRADPEALAAHWRGAGEIEQGAKYTVLAADRAARALAFERAAALYRTALELGASDRREHLSHALKVKLADALVNAGRGAEAAEVYLAAAGSATAADALDLKRRAAEQLLRCGHIDEALGLYRTIQRTFGMPLAETPGRAVASLVFQRARIRLRGVRFTERDETQVARSDLARIDTGFFVGLGLTTVDTIRGAELLARQFLLALDVGEPYRVARAVALEAALNASSHGAQGHKRTSELVEVANAIATRLDQPHALGLAKWAAGTSAYLEGRWRDGYELNELALAIYRDRCTGVAWEAASAQAFSLWSLHYLGELAEIGKRVPELIKQARDRGDLYDSTNLRTSHTNFIWLAADDPGRAAAEVRDAIEEWSPKGFHLQHYYELHALAQCELYMGRGAAAYERVRARWTQMRRAFLFEVFAVRLEMLFLRARAALATAKERAAERSALLAVAHADARKLADANMLWSSAFADLVRAGIAAAEGQAGIAYAQYGKAADAFDLAQMRLHGACARRRQGQLLQDSAGGAMVEQAEGWMRDQNIVNPARVCALIAPAPMD